MGGFKKAFCRHFLAQHLKTIWSARIDVVKPVAPHLQSLQSAFNEFALRTLSAEAQTQIQSSEKYLSKFECVVASTISLKLLVLLHKRIS